MKEENERSSFLLSYIIGCIGFPPDRGNQGGTGLLVRMKCVSMAYFEYHLSGAVYCAAHTNMCPCTHPHE